jgi:hypothetical protein
MGIDQYQIKTDNAAASSTTPIAPTSRLHRQSDPARDYVSVETVKIINALPELEEL